MLPVLDELEGGTLNQSKISSFVDYLDTVQSELAELHKKIKSKIFKALNKIMMKRLIDQPVLKVRIITYIYENVLSKVTRQELTKHTKPYFSQIDITAMLKSPSNVKDRERAIALCDSVLACDKSDITLYDLCRDDLEARDIYNKHA